MKYRVTYQMEDCDFLNYPVEVEAENESHAIMRAGMARETKYGWFNKLFYNGQRWRYPRWRRTSVEVIDGNV